MPRVTRSTAYNVPNYITSAAWFDRVITVRVLVTSRVIISEVDQARSPNNETEADQQHASRQKVSEHSCSSPPSVYPGAGKHRHPESHEKRETGRANMRNRSGYKIPALSVELLQLTVPTSLVVTGKCW